MPKKILVVDDDLHSREGLRDTLLGQGYQVETSADGWQAIRKIKEGRIDIAIIDLDLPTVHGVTVSAWDLARIFRAYHPAISIIVVGAEEEGAVRVQAEQSRVYKFLVKPISPAQLKALVKTLDPPSEECSAGTNTTCSGSACGSVSSRSIRVSPTAECRGHK